MYCGIKGEIKKLINYKPLLYVFAILLVIISYIFKQSTQDFSTDDFPAYYVSIMLLTLTVLGVSFPIITGGIAINGETSWNTWSLSVVNSGRKNLIIAKVITLFISCVSFPLFIYIGSLLLTLMLGKVYLLQGVFFKTLLQLIVVILVCFFWGISSMVISFLTKSVAFGVTFCIIYSLMEPIVYQTNIISDNIKRYLPLFNIRGILLPVFNNLENGSLLIVPYDNYNSIIYSIMVILGYVFLMGVIFILKYKKHEFQ